MNSRKRTSSLTNICRRSARWTALAAAGISLLAASPAQARGAVAELSFGGQVAAKSPARTAQTCAGSDEQPSAQNVAEARAAILCLVNRERTRRGLRALQSSASLRRAATAHSRDMTSRNYFDHVSPAGNTMVDRARRSGYVGRGGWTLGENIAWGTGRLATPEAIVDSWMRSPGHRANILRSSFRDLGVGVALGVPVRGVSAQRGGGTFTTVFGARS